MSQGPYTNPTVATSGPFATPRRPQRERGFEVVPGVNSIGSPGRQVAWGAPIREARPASLPRGTFGDPVPCQAAVPSPGRRAQQQEAADGSREKKKKEKRDRNQRSGPAAPRGGLCDSWHAHPRFQDARAVLPRKGNTAQEPEGQEPQ
ncbi:hypothetical protein NDU88_004139 [Pleurodeles waltl]|uniref:Uncharacterized protein n=1 Tax=Pleurodeles waltl TaxID=8319 RepID=A0AAV7LH82_PLEWA|nr:hypothetical protein NDU88_004139 [Pleurodeles waltl]